jgi:hypothetical protein
MVLALKYLDAIRSQSASYSKLYDPEARQCDSDHANVRFGSLADMTSTYPQTRNGGP